ncbi:hypothetical protein SDC9_29607 [bioreactor metagenome]|uniref:Uncharacterized protein n=1 Tax=bioreactor metagenome TaxID=1076179 RepID=A0A644UY94_9ZZZZ
MYHSRKLKYRILDTLDQHWIMGIKIAQNNTLDDITQVNSLLWKFVGRALYPAYNSGADQRSLAVA